MTTIERWYTEHIWLAIICIVFFLLYLLDQKWETRPVGCDMTHAQLWAGVAAHPEGLH